MSAINERDDALSILNPNLRQLSQVYRLCYLSMGKGALLAYAKDIISKRLPSKINYLTKEDLLDIFDSPTSESRLIKIIDNYNPRTEGILILITDYSNATFFVTVNLK